MSYKKYKDLEDNIKNQSDKIDVPDVYSNVKDTPIRKLKKGQAPSKYFSRKAALAVLAFLTLMLVIMAVAFLAMALSNDSKTDMYSPAVISISIEKDGTKKDYLMLCENSGTILSAINITDDKLSDNIHGLALTDAISKLNTPAIGDIIYFNIISNNSDLSQNLTNEFKTKLNVDYKNINYTFNQINNTEALTAMANYVNSKIENSAITKDSDISSIYQRLTEIAEKF